MSEVADNSSSRKAAATWTYWNTQIEAAQKREGNFRKEGQKIVEMYEGQDTNTPFNILYSNTETLSPALYNTTPRPVVKRRFKDDDPVGKAGAEVLQRTLSFYMDPGSQEDGDFDCLIKQAVLEALTPGRGITRFKYVAELETVPVASPALDLGSGEAGNSDPDRNADLASSSGDGSTGDGDDTDAKPYGRVKYECVEGEEIPWDRFLTGYAKKWHRVPWIAFEHFFTKEEAVEEFGKEAASWEYKDNSRESAEDTKEKSVDDDHTAQRTLHVFEIWHKAKKEVVFFAPAVRDRLLKPAIPDPLELKGFYPIPRPLTFMPMVSGIIPVALYTQYREQAEELNRITGRIHHLIKMLKVAGMYDASVDDLVKALEAEDGVLSPMNNVAALSGQNGALEKAIWLLPIDTISAVLQGLYLQREQCKRVIYEINGVSDILRGSTVASETATAQKIKDQWGTLRLKKLQREVQRYTKDCLRLIGEIAVTKLGQPTIQTMTGLKYPTAEEQAKVQQMVQEVMSQPMQGPPPPEIQQSLAQAQELLKQPSWEDVLAALKDDVIRSYKVDIETNSTVDAEATEDKQDISDLLNAMSQFMSGVAPLVESGAMPFEAAQAMLLMIVRRFRLGDEIEDALKKMQPPKPPDDGKVEAEKVKQQTEQMKGQIEMEKMRRQDESDKLKVELERQALQQEMAFKKEEHVLRMIELAAKIEAAQRQAEIQQQTAVTQHAMNQEASREQHTMKMAQMKEQGKMKPAAKTGRSTN